MNDNNLIKNIAKHNGLGDSPYNSVRILLRTIYINQKIGNYTVSQRRTFGKVVDDVKRENFNSTALSVEKYVANLADEKMKSFIGEYI